LNTIQLRVEPIHLRGI